MQEFTFGIVTYNQEKIILETLESIKYQIQKYGEGKRMNLVVSDDCSNDRTTTLVEYWLKKNRKIFNEATVYKSDINKGVSENFSFIMNKIQTKYYKLIAGDDLFSSHNIFDYIVNDDNIHVFLKLCFRDGKVKYNKIELANHFYYWKIFKHTNKKDIRLVAGISPYATPELFIDKDYFSTDCFEFISQYRNYEDDPYLYYILKNNPKAKFVYHSIPMQLYRQSDNALTSGIPSIHQILFLDDMHKFRKLLLFEEKNFFFKMFRFFEVIDSFLMKHRFDASKCIDRVIIKNKKRSRYELST